MVDQAEVRATNGREELPPRAVARGTMEFLHDVTTLGELQAKLVLIDCRTGLGKLLWPVVAIVIGACFALGSIPIALAALALTLVEFTELTLAASFGIALLAGVALAAVPLALGIVRLRNGLGVFDRSLAEWRKNVQWAKETLRRISRNPTPSPPSAVRR